MPKLQKKKRSEMCSKKKVQKVVLFIIYIFIKKRIVIFFEIRRHNFSVWQRLMALYGMLTIQCHSWDT